MTYRIVYFGFPGMTTTWDNFSLLYVDESQSISEAYNSGLQTQLHKVQTVCLVSVLTADPFLASRDFCVNVFLDYLSLFIHNIGPKYDHETKLISNLIS